MIYLAVCAAVAIVLWFAYKQGRDSGSAQEKSTHQEATLVEQAKENTVASMQLTDDDAVNELQRKADRKHRLETHSQR